MTGVLLRDVGEVLESFVSEAVHADDHDIAISFKAPEPPEFTLEGSTPKVDIYLYAMHEGSVMNEVLISSKE
ncbi:MAG: hypothetical protein ACRDTD_20830 [Pseudonocardiaceae bacterium]